MGRADEKIAVFEDSVLLPSLEEVSKAQRLVDRPGEGSV